MRLLINEWMVQVIYDEHTDINNTNLFAKKNNSVKQTITDNNKY
jgi:hypothetical protein